MAADAVTTTIPGAADRDRVKECPCIGGAVDAAEPPAATSVRRY